MTPLEAVSPAARERIRKERWLVRLASSVGAGCRDWPWGVNNKGYGAIRSGGVSRKVTHVVLELSGRPRPTSVAFALHSCDRPVCVAPWHLRWGTPADNVADRTARGRLEGRPGEANPSARLTDDDVRAIRASGDTLRSLGAQYGVHFTIIQKIKAGKIWRHLLEKEST